jgi:hypothetical protein
MTREELREKINLLEILDGVLSAIEDFSSVEYGEGEERSVDIAISDRSPKKAEIALAHRVPHGAVLAGLRAMQRELEQMLVEVEK